MARAKSAPAFRLPRWAGVAVAVLCSLSTGASSGGLPEAVDAALARHRLPVASLSVLVQDVAAPEAPLVSHRPDVARHPASTTNVSIPVIFMDRLPFDPRRTRCETMIYLRAGTGKRFHGSTPPATGEMPALPYASAVGEHPPAEGS